MAAGEVIEDYPHDYPYPSRLILGWCGSRPLHVVAAENEAAGETIVLAQDVPISAIPSSGYTIASTETGISQVTAVGGIAELPGITEGGHASSTTHVLLRGLGAAAAASVIAGAWYARKRWVR